MNIQNPIEINFTEDVDYSQESFMTKTLILNYTTYLMNVADKIDMEVSISTLLDYKDRLDLQDNILLNKNFPLFHIQIKDGDELLSEFVYADYSIPLYGRFREWILIDVLFYMKSKMLYRELDTKLPDKVKVKQSFKAKI